MGFPRLFIFKIGLFSFVLISCGGSNSTTSTNNPTVIDSTKPTTLVAAVGGALGEIANIMDGSRGDSYFRHEEGNRGILTAANCQAVTGEPTTPGTGALLDYTDVKFPGLLTYCKLKSNSGTADTIQGAFDLPKRFSCALERAGISWTGSKQRLSLTLDENCFTASQLSSVFGGASSVNITVSATSSPANTYFDREITLTVDPIPVNSDPSLRSWYGATYKYMTKVSGSLAEFVIKEDQSTSGGTTYNVFAGAYNTSTGVLRYEARMNTAQDPITSTSFYRHIRLLGDLAITGSTVTGIEDLAFAYGNSSKTEVNPTDLAQARAYTYAGFLVTAKGDLTKGIKARGWKATNGSGGAPTDYTAHFTTAPSNWVEITNTYCFASSSDSLDPCQTAGIDGYSAGDWQKFTYIYNANPTLPTAFYSTYPGMDFTQVNVNVDLPWTPTKN